MGCEVTLHFDEDKFSGSGVYLFGAILERFLGMYASMNSFTRTAITTNRREGSAVRVAGARRRDGLPVTDRGRSGRWQGGATLVDHLVREPFRFDFFEAVRRMALAAAER